MERVAVGADMEIEARHIDGIWRFSVGGGEWVCEAEARKAAAQFGIGPSRWIHRSHQAISVARFGK